MRRSDRNVLTSLLAVAILLAATVPALAGAGHGAGQDHATEGPYDISFTTHPSAENIVPDDGTVETIIEVTKNGDPADGVTLSYRLDAPPKTFWFGTEFPIVEGTPLLQGTLKVTDGTQLFDLVYPIRGNYTLRATVTGPEGTSKETFTIPVSGKFQEKINLAIFLLGLFLIGALGGYFLTTGRSGRSTAALLALAGLGVFMLQPAAALAHGKGSYNPDALEERIGTSGRTDDYKLAVRTFPQPARVGEMLDVTYGLKKTAEDHHDPHAHGHQPSGEILAEVEFVHTEGGKKFISQSVPLRDSRANFQVQLFDGAAHFMLTKVYRSTETKHAGDHHGSTEKDGHDGERDGGDPAHHGESEAPAEHDVHQDEEHAGETTDEHGHGHGATRPWEWQGQVSLEPGTYTVAFEESSDPAMKWLLLPTGMDHREEAAKERMQSCESASPGTLIPADNQCHNLKLNADGTSYELTVEEAGTYRLFTQHVPDEFDMSLLDAEGNDLAFEREFFPGKGELILTDVRRVDVQPVSPPIDDIVKVMLTLLGVIGLGFLAAWRFKVAMA